MSRIYSVDTVHVESLISFRKIRPQSPYRQKEWVTTSGWTRPDLSPWMYIMPPADGILDLDFRQPRPPSGIVLQVFCKIGVVKFISGSLWPGCGVSEFIVRRTKLRPSLRVPPTKVSDAVLMGEGWPLPWPFPWWAPKAKAQ